MKLETPHRRTRTSEKVSVTGVSAEEQAQRVHDAVARRAYEIFETHKGAGRQQVQDWAKAESEVMHPFCGGRMPINGNLWVGTDPSAFQENSIEVWVAPHRVTICGVRKASEEAMPAGERARDKEKIYEVIDLREEVDPSHVAAEVKSSALEIILKKAKHARGTEREFKAAA